MLRIDAEFSTSASEALFHVDRRLCLVHSSPTINSKFGLESGSYSTAVLRSLVHLREVGDEDGNYFGSTGAR